MEELGKMAEEVKGGVEKKTNHVDELHEFLRFFLFYLGAHVHVVVVVVVAKDEDEEEEEKKKR